ncbi:MAG: glycosyl hydrolase family 8 [Candidatus Omnitrophica bacterium]|nr:glycosyl hydrolase family 8 [Candidatus Omnitrophota bacterium]
MLFFLPLLGAAAVWFFLDGRTSARIVEKTWKGYQERFIAPDGCVMRLKERDSVSEGQAYALLRSVWMGDKPAFDRIYRWTESHLSRSGKRGDHLLAWRWKDGEVVDWMPASDADIDYALALIFAARAWPSGAPEGLEGYEQKALVVLNDILRLETYRTASGRLYLAPWILGEVPAGRGRYPVNPSYYSPAHFRIFYALTDDPRWLELAETTYFVLDALAKNLGGQAGAGLFPDWCCVDDNDAFEVLAQKSADFGWEAVRIPLRVVLDDLWFGSAAAEEILRGSIGRFAASEYKERGKIFCEYTYAGEPLKEYESPLFYAAYYCAVLPAGGDEKDIFLKMTRRDLSWRSGLYGREADYFVNSLAWIADGIACGVVRNVAQEGGTT